MKQGIVAITTIVIFYALMSVSGICLANSQFNEDFSDGYFTTNPAWTIWHATYKPGTVTIVDGAARFYRSGAGGSGRSEGMELSIAINLTSRSTVTFDAKPVYRSVRSGCGDSCTEHPVNIQLTLEDNTGNEFQLRYAVNYDGAVKNVTKDNFKQIAYSTTRNTWARNLSYKISDSFPTATKITHIKIFAAGWDFDGYIDNIKISGGTTPPPPTSTPGKVSLLPVYNVLLGNKPIYSQESVSGLGDFSLFKASGTPGLDSEEALIQFVRDFYSSLLLSLHGDLATPVITGIPTSFLQGWGWIPTFTLLCQREGNKILPVILVRPHNNSMMNDWGHIRLEINNGSGIFSEKVDLETTRTNFGFMDGNEIYAFIPNGVKITMNEEQIAQTNDFKLGIEILIPEGDSQNISFEINLDGIVRDWAVLNDTCEYTITN